jgi:hypothetical protein
MPVRLLSPRTGFVIVATLFLILAPETVRAQPATHSGVFKIDASRSIFIWENRPLSVGPQNVLVTVCVTTGPGVNVTVDGGSLFGVGVSSPPFDAACRTGNIQVTRTIELSGAIGHVEGTYTVSTNLK